MPNAIILLSGGVDSATTLAIAKAKGFSLHALTFRYGQRHAAEVESARAVANFFGVLDYTVVDIDLRVFGNSALTDNIEVPKNRSFEEMCDRIPNTYVPARNTIFLSYALALAEKLRAFDIFIGMNALDYGGYPDCRPEYVAAFEKMANLATKFAIEGEGHVKIHSPLINLTKAEIIRQGLALGVNYELTMSCYDPSSDGAACGTCDACLLRLRGFAENAIRDPAKYRDHRLVTA